CFSYESLFFFQAEDGIRVRNVTKFRRVLFRSVIENHNNIEEMRNKSNKDFPYMKRNLIIGVRKTHKFVENHKVSDFLVPYTSSRSEERRVGKESVSR